jgi:tetratricopeptide (TPR) repeat protein
MGKSDTWMHQGKYLFASGKYEEAIKCFNRVIQKDPEIADSWLYKGRSLYYQHKYLDAMRCFERLIACDPNNEEGRKGILQCSDKQIEQNPKDPKAWESKIEALMNLDRQVEAVEICDMALGFALINAPRAWNWMGDALRAKRSFEEAIKYYNKSIKQDPKNEDAWINKAKASYILGSLSDALMCCDRAI